MARWLCLSQKRKSKGKAGSEIQGAKDEKVARGHPDDVIQQFAPCWDLWSPRQRALRQLPWVREGRVVSSQSFQQRALLVRYSL